MRLAIDLHKTPEDINYCHLVYHQRSLVKTTHKMTLESTGILRIT